MKLPGLTCVTSDRPELILRAADSLALSFMEEPYTAELLSALDGDGAGEERKLEIQRASVLGSFEAHAPHRAVYVTDDLAAVSGCYLASEFGDANHDALEEEGQIVRVLPLLNAREAELLEAKSAAMRSISHFEWAADAARADYAAGLGQSDDHIYIYAWAVDVRARGTGAFWRMCTPLFDYADEHGINVYLDCFNDNLQALYEHVGFEVVRTFEDESVPIYERCMARRPRECM